MRIKLGSHAVAVLASAAVAGGALAGGGSNNSPAELRLPPADQIAVTTVFKPALSIEGLTADARGNLYTGGRGGDPCPVYRVPASGGAAAVVGNLPAPCNPAGLTLGRDGRLYVANGPEILVLAPDAASPPTATVFADGVPGANGVAFDRRGNLWVSDGSTGQGRVWRVSPNGTPTEAFRVQPMANEVNVDAGVGGVGRDPRTLPPGTITITPNGRSAANTQGSQHIVANGLAFDEDGTLLVADTARGAIWKVKLDRRGEVRSPMGCDTTFTPNTLCLENVLVAHPLLEGADGLVLDRAGNAWVTANERNAIVVATPGGRVLEAFRNAPDAATRLRNDGPLEFPTSPVFVGRRLCVTSSDVSRRDNFPNSEGEVGPGRELAKIACAALP